MLPEETSLLARFGRSLLFNLMFNNLEETLLWSVHAGLTITALIVLWRRGLHTRLLKFLFVVMLLLLLLSSSITALDWASNLKLIDLFLIKNPDLDLKQRLAIASAKTRVLRPPGNWLVGNPGLMFLIGDLVVLIRGYVLWTQSKLFFIFPIFIFFASVVFTLLARLLKSGVVIVSNARVLEASGITAIACTIATNAIVTAMIAYQALTHWKAMKDLGTRRSTASRILFYMVEGGVLYFAIQVVLLTLALLDVEDYSTMDYASFAFLTFAYHVSITYPALVILIVASNRSLRDEGGISGLSNMESLDIGSRIAFSDQRTATRDGQFSSPGLTKGSGNTWIADDNSPQTRSIAGRKVESDDDESNGSIKEKV